MLIVALIFGALCGLPLLIGIWLPDVITAPQKVLAEQRLATGHSFQVIQYWNRVDFYTTALVHTDATGKMETYVLDGDDSKTWSVPMVIDETRRTASVTLKGGRVRKVDWR